MVAKKRSPANDPPIHEAFPAKHADLIVERPNVFVGWVTLTPDLAREILKRNNSKNRKLNRRLVSKYAKMIHAGQWVETGETGIIGSDGIACSLQHRCEAVVEANMPIVILMVVGVDPITRWIVDSGRSKRAIDRVVMEDASTPDAGTVASAYRWLMRNLYGCIEDVVATSNITDFDLRDVMAEFPDVPECCYEMRGLRNRFGGRGLHGWLLWEFRQRDAELAKEYVDCVRDGVIRSKGSVWFALNRRLISNAEGPRSRSARTLEIAAWTIKAWNLARKGETVQVIRWREGEQFPEIN